MAPKHMTETSRRGFLGLLGVAPLAALPLAVSSETAAYDLNQETYTIEDPTYDYSGMRVGTTTRVIPLYKRQP